MQAKPTYIINLPLTIEEAKWVARGLELAGHYDESNLKRWFISMAAALHAKAENQRHSELLVLRHQETCLLEEVARYQAYVDDVPGSDINNRGLQDRQNVLNRVQDNIKYLQSLATVQGLPEPEELEAVEPEPYNYRNPEDN